MEKEGGRREKREGRKKEGEREERRDLWREGERDRGREWQSESHRIRRVSRKVDIQYRFSVCLINCAYYAQNGFLKIPPSNLAS